MYKITEIYKLLYQNICSSALFTVVFMISDRSSSSRLGCFKHSRLKETLGGNLSVVVFLLNVTFSRLKCGARLEVHTAHVLSLLSIFSSTVSSPSLCH